MYQLNRKATAHPRPRLPRIPIERNDHQKDITQKSRQTELESKLNNLIPGNNTDVWYRQSVDVQFVLLVLFSAQCDRLLGNNFIARPRPNGFFSTRLLGCRLGHVSTVKSAKGIRNCYNAISREINWDVLFVQILWGILRFSAVLVFINTSSPRI